MDLATTGFYRKFHKLRELPAETITGKFVRRGHDTVTLVVGGTPKIFLLEPAPFFSSELTCLIPGEVCQVDVEGRLYVQSPDIGNFVRWSHAKSHTPAETTLLVYVRETYEHIVVRDMQGVQFGISRSTVDPEMALGNLLCAGSTFVFVPGPAPQVIVPDEYP